MGTTVLNGTSWPLNRKRMSDYLGFSAIVDNAYDASQISSIRITSYNVCYTKLLRADLGQVQSRDFFVQQLRQHVHLVLVVIRIGEELERQGCDARAFGRSKIGA